VSTPPIDEAELSAMLIRAGLTLTPEQVKAILPGAEIFRRMIARVNTPLPLLPTSVVPCDHWVRRYMPCGTSVPGC
jgi:hypothetical protein